MDKIVFGLKKDVAFIFYAPLLAFSSTNADPDTIETGVTVLAADFQTSQDGSSFANMANTPTEVPAGSGIYEFSLTASEMNGNSVVVKGVSTAGTKAFKDTAFVLLTRVTTTDDLVRSTTPANALTVDASGGVTTDTIGATALTSIQSQILSDATPFPGADIDAHISSRAFNNEIRRNTAQSGTPNTITLDAGASSTDNFYTDQLIFIFSGTGQGQAFYITNYVGSTKVATIAQNWYTQPDSTSVFVIIPAGLEASNLANLDVAVSSRAPDDEIRRNTAQAGGANTITLDAGASAIDSFYVYQLVYIVSGTGAGQALLITSYVGSTKVATVNQNWYVQPDSTSVFAILPVDLNIGNLANLDVAVSSRASATYYTSARAANLDNLDTTVSSRLSSTDSRLNSLTNLDVAVSSRASATYYTAALATQITANLDTNVGSRAAPGNAMALVASAIGPTTITQAGMNAMADSTIRRNYVNAHASSFGDSLNPRSLLGAIAKNVNRLTLGANLQFYHEDDATVFGSQPVTTTPGATPVTALGGS